MSSVFDWEAYFLRLDSARLQVSRQEKFCIIVMSVVFHSNSSDSFLGKKHTFACGMDSFAQ
jgi:hypothetical protein